MGNIFFASLYNVGRILSYHSKRENPRGVRCFQQVFTLLVWLKFDHSKLWISNELIIKWVLQYPWKLLRRGAQFLDITWHNAFWIELHGFFFWHIWFWAAKIVQFRTLRSMLSVSPCSFSNIINGYSQGLSAFAQIHLFWHSNAIVDCYLMDCSAYLLSCTGKLLYVILYLFD